MSTATAQARRPKPPTTRVAAHPADGSAVYFTLLTAVLLLVVIGVVAVLSASAVAGLDRAGQPLLYFNRHLMAVGLATAVLLVTLGVDYRWWRRLALPLAGGVGLLLVAVLVFADPVNGSRRWLEVGPVTIQPSEPAKLALALSVAALLDTEARLVPRGVARSLLLTAAVGGLVLAQPDLGTTVVLAAVTLGALFAAGVPMRIFGALGVLLVPLGALAVVAADYRLSRVVGFLNPVEERQGAGYQTFQSLVGLAEGGAGGTGLGSGQAKWGWLPNTHTDGIFVIIGEETGLVGALVVLTLLAAIGMAGFRVVARAPDTFSRLTAAGITTWLMAQAFVNVGGVVGLLPITGIPLPFVSFGASSLVATAAAAGVLCNIARQTVGVPEQGTSQRQQRRQARRTARRELACTANRSIP